MFIDYVSVIISYIYHYRSMSRLTLSYGIRYVINPLNLAFPPAEVCAADVEFFSQNGRGECVRVVRHTRILIGQRRRLRRSTAGYSGRGPRAPLRALS